MPPGLCLLPVCSVLPVYDKKGFSNNNVLKGHADIGQVPSWGLATSGGTSFAYGGGRKEKGCGIKRQNVQCYLNAVIKPTLNLTLQKMLKSFSLLFWLDST